MKDFIEKSEESPVTRVGGPTVDDYAVKIRSYFQMELPEPEQPGTEVELAAILNRHAAWLASIEKPTSPIVGRRACFRRSDLRRRNLSRKDLRGADFSWCDLEGADLSGCDLRLADFTGANLQHAVFTKARVRDAKFEGANLSGARLDLAVYD